MKNLKQKQIIQNSKSLMSEEMHISRKGIPKLGIKGWKWQTS